MIKLPKYITLAVILLFGVTFFFVANHILSQSQSKKTLWDYQCIDTMKISRDAARSEETNPNARKEITKEVTLIKKLGANCIAVATPYDEEFVPYLKMWVEEARKEDLHVWFRGNFSSWEGWFSYPKGMTTEDHLQKTKQFILAHSDLFEDGDVFTPAIEAENGWGNGYVPQSDYPIFRQFLIDEHVNAQNAFGQIGKHVTTNWLSMSGGLAKDMLDAPTVTALDNTVTIDHYVDSPENMQSYIDYFKNTFHAKVVIGEFGAPIPDINGSMTNEEQSSFVDSVFAVLAQENDTVYAVNYWTLNNSSTALMDTNNNLKPVSDVLKEYYLPTIITGKVTNELGDTIGSVNIRVSNDTLNTHTTNYGQYTLIIPQQETTIIASKDDYITTETIIYKKGKIQKNIILKPLHPSMLYDLQLFVKNFFTSFFQVFTKAQ